MGQVLTEISDDLVVFIRAQHVSSVATPPRPRNGNVKPPPKGLDTFRILSPKRVAYADMTGSGNETSAHLSENGRITLMFCGFDQHPKILRLYGRGRAILRGDGEFAELSTP